MTAGEVTGPATVLEASELGRWYGQVVGLSELTVTVGPGVTGLLGPNGAGKSTFLRLIAGEIRPSRGRLSVLGVAPFANRGLYRRMGFAPQQDALYGSMTGREAVTFLMRLAGFGRSEADARARRALERTGLGPDMDRKIGGYSKGMRQRTKLAQAIAHDPELLVLDEPLNGLDPIGRRQVFDLLRELGEEGVHVLVSSHVLHEVETLTDEILLLHRGRLLAQGRVGEVRHLLDRHPRRVELLVRDARRLAQALVALPSVRSVSVGDDDDRLTVEARDLERFQIDLTDLAAADRSGYGLRSLESLDASLEAVFDYLIA